MQNATCRHCGHSYHKPPPAITESIQACESISREFVTTRHNSTAGCLLFGLCILILHTSMYVYGRELCCRHLTCRIRRKIRTPTTSQSQSITRVSVLSYYCRSMAHLLWKICNAFSRDQETMRSTSGSPPSHHATIDTLYVS